MRRSHLVRTLYLVFFIMMAPNMAMAITILDDFGSFPDATWGGSGIPNDAVAASKQIVDGNVTITLAMSATQRYSNPAPTNDGAGTYFAQTGSNTGNNGTDNGLGALWNFNYYMKVEGINGATPILADYQIDLLYDFDPGSNTPFSSLGKIDVTAFLLATASASTLEEDSQNLLFGFLAVDNLPFLDAPGGAFNPNAIGEYQFAIQVTGGGFNLETVAIEVQTVPVPAAVWLFGSGLLGLVGIARRKKA